MAQEQSNQKELLNKFEELKEQLKEEVVARQGLEKELKEQAKQLEMAKQELSTLNYCISHDLRAPLRAISGFAEIIAYRHRENLNKEGKRYFDNIVLASTQMGDLIDDLLTYFRLGRQMVRYQPVALENLLSKAINNLSTDTTNVQLTLPSASELPILYTDSMLLSEIFSHLLDNALTYHHPDVIPHITITCQEEGAQIIIGVRDNGIGIAAEFHDKIFHIFQRLHSPDEYPGTGIGLAIVQRLVKLLHGEVWVESTLAEGSTFYVKLPLTSAQERRER